MRQNNITWLHSCTANLTAGSLGPHEQPLLRKNNAAGAIQYIAHRACKFGLCRLPG